MRTLAMVWPAQAAVPAHSPYQAGDWVRLHGCIGHVRGPQLYGWRGFVTGTLGATILRGLTDDGRPWAEYWGALEPDRPRARGVFDVCTCCPRAVLGVLFQPRGLVRNGDLWWWRRQYGQPAQPGER